jgi:hypothetical protein
MAPEQFERPAAVDHRADIYSLGVVLYEMLTGELPLGRFAPPSQKVEVDVRLDEVVLRALEREPARRYQRASEVETDLRTVAAGQPSPDEDGPEEAYSLRNPNWFNYPRSQRRWTKFTWAATALVGLVMALSFRVGTVTVAGESTWGVEVGVPHPWLQWTTPPETSTFWGGFDMSPMSLSFAGGVAGVYAVRLLMRIVRTERRRARHVQRGRVFQPHEPVRLTPRPANDR